ncbi:hypothetical protein ACFQRD_07225 [Brachybacterium sp. GCM10030268]|uniref:hypothetical protein n=1 Tax=Brachybacterium sp. GCM10030268 TaxID=3273382 RepID=UPI00361DFA2B
MGSDSPAETKLRLAVIREGIPEPQINVEIFAGPVSLGTPDLSWAQWQVCLEHEGPSHRTPQQQERDIERSERRRDHGWVEIQTTARDLRSECHRAVDRISENMRRQGWTG